MTSEPETGPSITIFGPGAIGVCTCSTIAGQAEIEGAARAINVMRVDRPMAVAAVRAGRRITVLAALESTLGPTTDLLAQVTASRGAEIGVTVPLCDGAWECFEGGDLDGYISIVAAECDAAAESSDVIVLAQAVHGTSGRTLHGLDFGHQQPPSCSRSCDQRGATTPNRLSQPRS